MGEEKEDVCPKRFLLNSIQWTAIAGSFPELLGRVVHTYSRVTKKTRGESWLGTGLAGGDPDRI